MLASHLPGETPFASAIHTGKNIVCVEPFDYWRGIFEEWDTDRTLIIVEHDMEVSDDLIARLLAEPHPLVSFAYPLYWVSTGKGEPQYAQRVGDFPPDRKYLGTPVREGDAWADFTGIGLCKISPQARQHGPPRQASWQHVDMAVNAAISGRWRVLWPEVAHFHL